MQSQRRLRKLRPVIDLEDAERRIWAALDPMP